MGSDEYEEMISNITKEELSEIISEVRNFNMANSDWSTRYVFLIQNFAAIISGTGMEISEALESFTFMIPDGLTSKFYSNIKEYFIQSIDNEKSLDAEIIPRAYLDSLKTSIYSAIQNIQTASTVEIENVNNPIVRNELQKLYEYNIESGDWNDISNILSNISQTLVAQKDDTESMWKAFMSMGASNWLAGELTESTVSFNEGQSYQGLFDNIQWGYDAKTLDGMKAGMNHLYRGREPRCSECSAIGVSACQYIYIPTLGDGGTWLKEGDGMFSEHTTKFLNSLMQHIASSKDKCCKKDLYVYKPDFSKSIEENAQELADWISNQEQAFKENNHGCPLIGAYKVKIIRTRVRFSSKAKSGIFFSFFNFSQRIILN